jgi:hypothetical protein
VAQNMDVGRRGEGSGVYQGHGGWKTVFTAN